MELLKRCLGAALAFLLLVSLPVSGWAAEENDEKSVYESKYCGLVSALGIVDLDQAPESPLTRGSYAAFVCRLLGYANGSKSGAAKTMTDTDYMDILNAMGIVNGYSDNDYRESRVITVSEAVTILVRALGYGAIAEAAGGYPYGYRQVAATLKLTDKGVNWSDKLTYGFACQLLENALETEYLELKSIGESTRYQADGNLLQAVFEIEKLEGVLDGIDLTRLAGVNDVPPHSISVDGTELRAGAQNCHALLGYRVTAYYRQTGGNDPALVYLKPSEKNQEITLDIEDISKIASGKLEAVTGQGRKKSYAFGRIHYLIFNGVSTEKSFDEALIAGKNGSVKLLDNDADGSYDVIFVECYEDFVVAQRDAVGSKIYDTYDRTKSIELDTESSDPYTLIYNEQLAESSIGSIDTGDVVSVYCSADDAYQQLIRAYVSKKKVSGEVKQSEDNCKKLTVGDITYTMTDRCYEKTMEKYSGGIPVGQMVTLSLNAEGKIASLTIGGSGSYGYLVQIHNAGAAFVPDVQIKMYCNTDDGYRFRDYTIGKRVKLDGKKYAMESREDYTAFAAALHNSAKLFWGEEAGTRVTAQLLLYTADENGTILSMDTAAQDETGAAADYTMPEGDNSAYMQKLDSPSYSYTMDTEWAYFRPNTYLHKTLPVFHYPSPLDGNDYLDETLYYVDNPTDAFERDGKANGTVHAMFSKDSFIPDVIGVTLAQGAGLTVKTHERLAAVKAVSTVLADGEDLYKLNVICEGYNTFVYLKKDFVFSGFESEQDATLKPEMTAADLVYGDLIRYKTDERGYAKDVVFYYRAASGVCNPAVVGVADIYAQIRMNKVVVMKVDRQTNGFWFVRADSVEEAAQIPRAEWEKCCGYFSKGVSILKYDSTQREDNRLSTASWSELYGYEETGADCTQMILHQYDMYPFGAYIIR